MSPKTIGFLLVQNFSFIIFLSSTIAAYTLTNSSSHLPKRDGACTSYFTVTNDNCWSIGQKYGVTAAQLAQWNDKVTWGWPGCDGLPLGINICVSAGTPPMPAPVPDAVCGPTKPGSQPPGAGEDLLSMNPCPLNVCCDMWGQCGQTPLFCDATRGPTGNPGTKPAGDPTKNGCISNCALTFSDLKLGGEPASQRTVGYYESWNFNRPCMTLKASNIDTSTYDTIHWAFGLVDPSTFEISSGDRYNQFRDFKALKVHKVLSLGGWDYSTMPNTSNIFRTAMQPGNVDQFVNNIIKFLNNESLDGIDIDWEYPGAPGGNGMPPGLVTDAPNYLAFLQKLQGVMPQGKTISIAAPASYWYLKQFPIGDIAKVVDYIVYMTYDLHGAWDYGNKWSQDGCPAGNCLRSHINSTETMYALTMAVKAGVPQQKIMVGVSSYGRSFKMSQSGCTGPACTYTGPTDATPGRCSGTAGYIGGGELNELWQKDGAVIIVDGNSGSDILVYNDANNGEQWVSFMTQERKNNRRKFYALFGFGGTTDWAIDLMDMTNDQATSDSGNDSDDYSAVYLAPGVFTGDTAQCTPPCRFVLPPNPLGSTTTISIPDYTTSIDIGSGTTMTITVTVPAITTDSMNYYNYILSSTSGMALLPGQPQIVSSFQLTPSLPVPSVVTVVTTNTITETRTIILPPWPLIMNGPPDTSVPKPTDPSETPGGIPPIPNVTPPAPIIIPDDPKPSYGSVVPVETPTPVWPVIGFVPVETDVPDGGEDPDGPGPKYRTTCKLWFFFVCINYDDDWFHIDIGGWEWNLPEGTWGPGPPALDKINLPPGFTIEGTLPPWPRITVGPGGAISPPPEPTDCTPVEASLCVTTSSFATTVDQNGVTSTTATQTKSKCETITGCNFKDASDTINTDVCSLPTIPPNVRRALEAQMTGLPEPERLHKRALLAINQPDWKNCPDKGNDGILLPKNPENNADMQVVQQLLENRKNALGDDYGYEMFHSTINGGFTGFYFVQNMGVTALNFFGSNEVPQIWKAYNLGNPEVQSKRVRNIQSSSITALDRRSSLERRRNLARNKSVQRIKDTSLFPQGYVPLLNNSTKPAKSLFKRTEETTPNWHLSQICTPSGYIWSSKSSFKYRHDNTLGAGQTIYIMESEITNGQPETGTLPSLSPRQWGPPKATTAAAQRHGYYVASYALGQTVGIARRASGIFVPVDIDSASTVARERALEAFLLIADDLVSKGEKGKAVVNMSWEIGSNSKPIWTIISLLMQRMQTEYGVVFVAAAGNSVIDVYKYPAMLSPEIGGMFVVGAYGEDGKVWKDGPGLGSNTGNEINAWAPGADLPRTPDPYAAGDMERFGTSHAAALVSGLVAYWRAADPGNSNLLDPLRMVPYIYIVKKGERLLTMNPAVAEIDGLSNRYVWNMEEQSGDFCTTPQAAARGLLGRRDGTCPSGSPSGPDGDGPTITFEPGPNGPSCTTNCGTLCKGFYCLPHPTGTPPDYIPPPSPTPNAPTDPQPQPPANTPQLPTLPHDSSLWSRQCTGNHGPGATRKALMDATTTYCTDASNQGTFTNPMSFFKTISDTNLSYKFNMQINSACSFSIDGTGDKDSLCGQIMRYIIDGCDPNGENNKHAGSATVGCATFQVSIISGGGGSGGWK